MGDTYRVIFKNNSDNLGSVCLYQVDPTLDTKVMSLAWLTKTVHPTTTVEVSWNINYNFVWSETGELVPGVIFKAYQTWDADLRNNNKVRFVYRNGAYTFEGLERGNAGELLIEEDYSLPFNQASVGIGMSGSATFVSQAQPDMKFFCQPQPRYWITFGTFEQGEVLDITRITSKQEIRFPANVSTMNVTLNQDNTWTIEPFNNSNYNTKEEMSVVELALPEMIKDSSQEREYITGLPDKLKTILEKMTGISMNDIRIHYNSDKPLQVGAFAYKQGKDIYIAPKQEKYLVHELWHVVQQAQGRVKPLRKIGSVAVNDDVILEQEADEMSKIIQFKMIKDFPGLLRNYGHRIGWNGNKPYIMFFTKPGNGEHLRFDADVSYMNMYEHFFDNIEKYGWRLPTGLQYFEFNDFHFTASDGSKVYFNANGNFRSIYSRSDAAAEAAYNRAVDLVKSIRI